MAGPVCPICLDPLFCAPHAEEKVTSWSAPCAHTFHARCIMDRSSSNSSPGVVDGNFHFNFADALHMARDPTFRGADLVEVYRSPVNFADAHLDPTFQGAMDLSRSRSQSGVWCVHGDDMCYSVASSSEEDSDAAPGFSVAVNPGQAGSARHLPSSAAAVLSRGPVGVHGRTGEVRIRGSVGAQLQAALEEGSELR